MGDQQPPSRFAPLLPSEAWDKLTSASKYLKVQGSLSDRHSALATEAAVVLKTTQASIKRKKYKEFLCDAHCRAGPGGVLVCAVGLGQVKTADMKKADRDHLLRQIEINKVHFEHPILRSLANSHQIPISLDDIPEGVQPPQDIQPQDVQPQDVQPQDVQPPQSIAKRPRKRKRRANLGHSENQSPSGYELNDHSPQHAVERSRKRKRADTQLTSGTTNCSGSECSVAVQSPALWPQQPTAQPVQLNELRHSPPIPVNLEMPGRGEYLSFSHMRCNMVEHLPEPIRTGIKTNNLWREERESGGLEITNSLKIYLPLTPNEDSLLMVRLSYHQGFSIQDSLGLGDPEEKAAEKARD